MIIYSDTALAFLKKVSAFSMKVLRSEMSMSFHRKRLLFNGHFYPLEILVFEHPTILGQYDPNKFQVLINKNLMYKSDKDTLENIIRHELCHYITHVQFGLTVSAHGKEFHSTCAKFGYNKDVSCASIEIGENLLDKTKDKLFEKVTKLFKLASSQNIHEAELATAKANEILKKHHLEGLRLNSSNEEETLLKGVLTGKKVSGKHQAIYRILCEFLVAPVFSYHRGGFSLEVIGSRTNVLTADYIAAFLNLRLESMYESAKNDSSKIRGAKAKNSFMNGVAEGYLSKIKSSSSSSFSKQEIALSESVTQLHLSRVYPRLRGRSYSKISEDINAKSAGNVAGRSLNINPGLEASVEKTLLLER